MQIDFAAFTVADRLVLTDNLNRPSKTIADPETIDAVMAFLLQQKHHWGVPPGGVPVARLRLNFYADDRILGNVGVGQEFLSLHYAGGFYSKQVPFAVTEELRTLLGLTRIL
jgi:hypothetical protein